MKKLITMALAATLIAITSMPAEANLKPKTVTPTLAILDTALDTSIPAIKSRIVAEVCILDWPSCPNGTRYMEGPGSSVLPINILSTSSFNHGTQMVSAALNANPNLNIVFVRIVGNTRAGAQQTYGINTLANALSWVNSNRLKYNIVAVASSHATNAPVIRMKTADYCLPTKIDSIISTLNNSGIPVFFPSGNSGTNPAMKDKIEWPACIKQSVAVGGIETLNLDRPQVSLISNYDKNLVDLWGEVQLPTIYPGNKPGFSYGTSVSVQVIAAKYVQLKTIFPAYTADQLITLMKSSSVEISSPNGQSVYLFNLLKAING